MTKTKDQRLKSFKLRLHVGDTVIVRSGKLKGRSGKITKVYPKLNKVSIEGLNVVKRHLKPSQANPQGGTVELTKPLWVSKVAAYEPSAKKASRVGYKLSKDGSKSRTYKLSGKEIK